MLPDVFRQVSAGHPFGNELERDHRDMDEGDDVLVFQPLPHHSLFEERLWVSSGTVNDGSGGVDGAPLGVHQNCPGNIP